MARKISENGQNGPAAVYLCTKYLSTDVLVYSLTSVQRTEVHVHVYTYLRLTYTMTITGSIRFITGNKHLRLKSELVRKGSTQVNPE